MINKDLVKKLAAKASNDDELAEMVVRECMAVVNLQFGKPAQNIHWPAVSNIMEFMIKEHFGITDEKEQK